MERSSICFWVRVSSADSGELDEKLLCQSIAKIPDKIGLEAVCFSVLVFKSRP